MVTESSAWAPGIHHWHLSITQLRMLLAFITALELPAALTPITLELPAALATPRRWSFAALLGDITLKFGATDLRWSFHGSFTTATGIPRR